MNNEEEKERKYLKIMDHKHKINADTIYFKKWYMNHSLDWMDGFNESMKIFLDILNCKNCKYKKDSNLV